MASSSENEENSSADELNESEAIFYDAHSDWSDHEINQSHRWKRSSESDLSKISKTFPNLELTQSQLDELARRAKLQRLRDREEEAALQAKSISPLDLISTVSFRTQSFLHSTRHENQRVGSEESFSTPDLLKDHLDGEHTRRTEQNVQNSVLSSRESPMLINSATKFSAFQQQRSLPYPTLPSASSSTSRGSNGIYSKITNLSAISEPNIVDMTLTQFNELSATNRYRATGDDSFSPFSTHRFDQSKYIEPIDANPMTQTILERANGSTTVMSQRQNSILSKSHQLRRNSSDHDNINGSLHFEATMSRQRSQLKGGDGGEEDDDEDDDNESTSSESSSTKSSHTIAHSSPSNLSKSSKAAVRAASMLIRGGKRQLSRLMTRSFLRRNGRKPSNGHQQPVDVDEEEDDGEKPLLNDGFNGDLKYKSSRNLKEQLQFDKTQLLQTIVNAHRGPIWCMKFSPDGHLLATGGQDSLLKVWVLKSAQPYFQDFSRLTSNLSKQQNEVLSERFNAFHHLMSSETLMSTINTKLGLHETHAPLYSRPFCEFNGHQAPVLDVAWSKSLFLLSSSMDKTVRLWHLSRPECLCFFRHVDFVSAIAFHPRDDRYFISASLDGHVRLWNIPDKRVVYWTLIPAQASSLITAAQANLITAVHFCDEGRKVTVGTFDGRFLLYNDLLQYDTVMNIGDKDGSRSHRSRKKCRKPYKITGIETMNSNHCRVLITSNDSRIRLYDLRSKEIERKYRGYSNQSSQIRASFSHDDLYIISGSEDGWFYIWRTEPNSSMNNENTNSSNAAATRKQRRHFGRAFERIRVHNTMVTSAIFAPHPHAMMEFLYASTVPPANDNSNVLFPNRSNTNLTSLARSSNSTITPLTTNQTRTRLICVHGAPSPTELSTTTTTTTVHSNTYVMVTADSKGQLKLLVNRLHR